MAFEFSGDAKEEKRSSSNSTYANKPVMKSRMLREKEQFLSCIHPCFLGLTPRKVLFPREKRIPKGARKWQHKHHNYRQKLGQLR